MQNKFEMRVGAEADDGCSCPRCHDHIPEEFYCRNCGYVPDWRQRAYEEHEASREAAYRQRAAFAGNTIRAEEFAMLAQILDEAGIPIAHSDECEMEP